MSAKTDIPAVQAALTAHYARHARQLPWRRPPGDSRVIDPYHVWLSEVMLQQTTVAAVIPYFEKFVARWPGVTALAVAPDADVLAAWAGLGYYSRARNLIACARRVVADHAGIFPSDLAALQMLPGVGGYTAAAINAIAFDGAAVPVDANIERVVARLFAIAEPLPQAKRPIGLAAASIWPASAGGDFAQALMDLGATICTARAPKCAACPVAAHCAALRTGIAESLPLKAKKAARPARFGRALWHERKNGADREVWLVRRPPRGLLGGMLALPGTGWGEAMPAPAVNATQIGAVRHVFTHFALDLAVDRVTGMADPGEKGGWWPISRLDEAGLPTLYRRAAELALRER